MGKSNTEQLAILEEYLGKGGSVFRKYCGMKSGPYCNACVSYIFHAGDNDNLYCNGTKQTYCPTSINWCYKNLASIPPYLALPSDVIYFDWELNGTPNHVGFVRERKSCDEIYTIEGNTSKLNSKGQVVATGVVAYRTRNTKYVQAIFRPHFPASYKIGTLEVDGLMGYNTIAMLQYALKVEVDGILGKGTLRALQKWAGVKQDAIWGKGTSKAIQKKLGVTADGLFGKQSVMALQRWCNSQYKPTPAPTPAPTTKTEGDKIADSETQGDKIADSAKSYVGKVKYVKGGTSLKTGCDCTGFVQAIHKLHGIKLDVRKSWGKSVGKDVSKAKRGDVIYYYMNGKLHHMGIYVGNNRVVHNSTSHKDWRKDCIESNVKLSGFKIGDIRRCWK